MFDAIRKITISEVILLFILVFVLPLMTLMLLRLRKYETLFGALPESKKKRGKKSAAPEELAAAPAPAVAPKEDAVPVDVYPYAVRTFLTPTDHACLNAMREALGDEVDVFPKVALWELVESTDKAPGFLKRLHDKDYDFLVCDKRTGQPLTAVMYNPGKGRPAGRVDEVKKICKAAGANVVFIDMAEKYDVGSLKDALGLPDLDI